jgi:MATE family multidrug resistance protein
MMNMAATRPIGSLAPLGILTRPLPEWIPEIAAEAKQLSGIAGPLILSSLVSMGVSIIDLAMMAMMGPMSLSAGAVVSDFYSFFYYFFGGIIAALVALISRALGSGDHAAIRQFTQAGFVLALVLGITGFAIMWNADIGLRLIGIDDELIRTGLPYARTMAMTFTVMVSVNFLYFFLSAHGNSKVIFFTSLFALPFNALGNYALMFGNFGMPEMGLAGAGLASMMAACFMAAFMLASMARKHYFKQYALLQIGTIRLDRLREIFSLGTPIAVSNLGEMGVFMLSTVIMGRFGAEAVAAHVVVLRMAGVLYAVPFGFAQAATVRIGFAIGAGQTRQVLAVIKTAAVIAITFGSLYLILLASFRFEIVGLFLGTGNGAREFIAQSGLFLMLLALGQPLGCLGVVGNGILRGFKDTRKPMVFSMIAFWGVGFTGGLIMAYNFGMHGTGIWAGLAGSSIAFGILIGARLLYRWRRRDFVVLTK